MTRPTFLDTYSEDKKNVLDKTNMLMIGYIYILNEIYMLNFPNIFFGFR